MTILGNAFNIILFVSMTGGVFTLLSLFAKKALHIVPPLWFGLWGIALYLLPVIMPALWLVPPEAQVWLYGYKAASVIWLVGAAAFFTYYALRSALARRALQGYPLCQDRRIRDIYNECGRDVGLKKVPALYFGALEEPACVVSSFRPAVILNQAVAQQLTDGELAMVLCHELTHVKRGHPICQRLLDLVSALHWANPFVWIFKNDFVANCETDCDKNTLAAMGAKATPVEYAKAMLRLMELSSKGPGQKGGGLEALGFLLAKQRMGYLLGKPDTAKKRAARMAALALFTALALAFSLYTSRGYFYPYPAYDTGLEYAAGGIIFYGIKLQK